MTTHRTRNGSDLAPVEVRIPSRNLRFDIDLLASRLAEVTQWLVAQTVTRDVGIGYFGSSTGAGAALVAAAEVGQRVEAVVSRGGRPDLAGDALGQVKSPTLLIVGGYDEVVIRLNEEALAEIRCEKELKIVPGATHLFEEPGALEEVARLATDWFGRHFHAHLKAIDSDGTIQSHARRQQNERNLSKSK